MAGISLLATLGEPPSIGLEAPVVAQVERLPSETELQLYALKMSEKYGVSYHEMSVIIGCESSWNPDAVGDGIKSRGLVQIHSDFHSETDEQAFNPYYAIEFLAKKLSEGKGDLWTCWRKNFE